MIDKIALGTAQFGMKYGINNKRGKVPKEEVFAILNKAIDYGIDTVDTAYSYKDSESVIGEFIRRSSANLKVISKLPECKELNAEEIFNLSLKRLNIPKIYGYLIHNFEYYKKNSYIWNILEKFKRKKKIQKIGFSLYYPSELEKIFKEGLEIDIIQIPYSIFDRRFEPFFKEIKEKNIEIHVRSIFLQGLVFKTVNELNSFFSPLKEKIYRLNLLSSELNIPVFLLYINFALKNQLVDKVIIGVDSIVHFNEIVQGLSCYSIDDSTLTYLQNFQVNDENIIVPTNWRRYIKNWL